MLIFFEKITQEVKFEILLKHIERRPGIDLVGRDLEYHMIGLKTQCLWVTDIPIPGLH